MVKDKSFFLDRSFRDKISEILVKHNIPTIQVAISDILQVCEEEIERIINNERQ